MGGAVYRGIFVTAGLYGDIYGYNARNGRLVWRFHTVPRGREPGADTWSGPDTGFANCWGGLSIQTRTGHPRAAIGAPQTNFIGAGRLGDDLYGDRVVALDALTGRRLWYFQNLRHDIWDLDNPAAPNLVTITRDGRRIDAVTCLSKAGMLLLLDRTSGKPIFPFRLRRAPVWVLPGERTAPYQPDPERPEMFSRMDFRPEDVTTRTPQAHDFVLRQVERSTYGWFQPFTEDKPNLFIGSRGGGEWSGAAVDVPSGRLYVTSNHIPSKVHWVRRGRGPARSGVSAIGGGARLSAKLRRLPRAGAGGPGDGAAVDRPGPPDGRRGRARPAADGPQCHAAGADLDGHPARGPVGFSLSAESAAPAQIGGQGRRQCRRVLCV